MIVFSMALKNGASTIRRAVSSIFSQKNFEDFILVIANDNSSDNWKEQISDFLQDRRCIALNVNFNNAASTRNFILEYAKKNFPKNAFVCRLDCDDEICDEYTMQKIEGVLKAANPQAALFGNKLRLGGKIIEKTNYAKKELLNPKYLIGLLGDMANGIAENEIPSCNLFLRNDVQASYPDEKSAEDHFLCATLLIGDYDFLIDESILYCIYSLSGQVTKENKNAELYYNSRMKLYKSILKKYHSEREQIALRCLNKYKKADYKLLGKGTLGIIFHDEKFVYKVCLEDILGDKDKFRIGDSEKLKYFKNIGKNYKSFVRILDVKNICGLEVIIEPYEEFSEVENFERDEIIYFLTDCFESGIIVNDIKAKNFIRTKDGIKLVDIEIKDFNDNLFLNMIARAFIYTKYGSQEKAAVLARSAINNFCLPELKKDNELQNFANEVFFSIIKRNFLKPIKETPAPNSCFSEEIIFDDNVNFEKFFFEKIREQKYLLNIAAINIRGNKDLCFAPERIRLDYLPIKTPSQPVTLLIKLCPMEARVAIPLVKHIVRQLSSPNEFFEIVVSVDALRENFTRQYDKGDIDLLNKNLQILLEQKIIDRIISVNQDDIAKTNKKYFGIDTQAAHSKDGGAATSQLLAFEQCKTDYVLQMDSDVMIVRKDYAHSFLEDMIKVFDEHENCISVGFNICQTEEGFKEYFGFEDGGFVPEVRLCLLKKSRIEKMLPVPNSVSEKGFELTWYRAFEKHQKTTGMCSVRGGDSRTFFIHPQNYRKVGFDIWLKLLNRVEQNSIPDFQRGKWDMAGSYYDWCVPPRQEKLVLVSCVRNISYSKFLRFFYSVANQNFYDWGMVLIDDASENGLGEFIRHCIKPYSEKISFIQNYERKGKAFNIYTAIHYYIKNENASVVIVDGDDALLEKNALTRIYSAFEFQGADVVVGKMYRTDEFLPHYKYTCDFLHPRNSDSNVWQHLHAFKKYLYDSLGMEDLKIIDSKKIGSFQKFSNIYIWPETCDEYSYMIPIIEMSSSPQIIDRFNYFYDKTNSADESLTTAKNKIIKEICEKKAKTKDCVFHGRKKFDSAFKRFIELDITYKCDLKCFGCNRSCTQAPTDLEMSLSQIEDFINESIEMKIKWDRISILGGEPTTHTKFVEIVKMILQDYVEKFSPETIVEIVSNGRRNAKEKIAQLPRHSNLRLDRVSEKKSNKVDYFSQFNDAPIDDKNFADSDFTKGCWVLSYCGINLNMFGYYCCSAAGGIDRVLSRDMGIKSLKEISDEALKKQKEKFCALCGNFKSYNSNFGNFIPRNEKEPFEKPVVSETWRKIYEKYNEK